MNKKGFTLIELLVVIAIIAILAAILFPVFNSARDKARATQCASNLKQLSISHEMYRSDYGGYTIPYGLGWAFWVGGTGWSSTWYDEIQPYLKNKNVIFCPSKKRFGDNLDGYANIGYGYNFWSLTLKNVGYSNISGPFAREQDVKYPGRLFVFGDSNSPYLNNWAGSAAGITPIIDAQGHIQSLEFRHNGGVNFAFFDGHVRWMNKKDSLDLTHWTLDGKNKPIKQ